MLFLFSLTFSFPHLFKLESSDSSSRMLYDPWNLPFEDRAISGPCQSVSVCAYISVYLCVLVCAYISVYLCVLVCVDVSVFLCVSLCVHVSVLMFLQIIMRVWLGVQVPVIISYFLIFSTRFTYLNKWCFWYYSKVFKSIQF